MSVPSPDNCPLCGTPLEGHLPEHLVACDADPTSDLFDMDPEPPEDWREAIGENTRQLTIDDL